MASGSSGVKQNAFAGEGNANNLASSAYDTINPIYTQMATSPSGYSPADLAAMRTASSQALGGGVAAAVGQGGLLAARTGNAGGAASAIDSAAETAGQQNSQNQLGVDQANANLKQKQMQEGLSGLNSIYDTNTQAALNYLSAANNAKPTFWQTLGGQAATLGLNNLMSA